jgi:hypothetical protein
MRHRRHFTLAGLLLAFLAVGKPALAGSVSYNVSVDTSTLSGQSGFVDFQFNPGPGALAATAALSVFATDGSLQGSPQLTGAVAGTLPGPVTLTNSTQFNDYFEGITFGTTITYDLTLSGDGVGGSAPSGSALGMSLFDSTGTNPLLTTDPNGTVVTVNVNPDGSTSPETFPQSPNDSTPAATVSLVTSVPEPSTLVLSSLPLGWAVWRRLRRRATA